MAKYHGLPNIGAKMDALNLMFKKPDVVLGDQTIDMSNFICKQSFTRPLTTQT